MEKIFEQYGGVIVTIIAIIALIAIVTFLVGSGENSVIGKKFGQLVDNKSYLLTNSCCKNIKKKRNDGAFWPNIFLFY